MLAIKMVSIEVLAGMLLNGELTLMLGVQRAQTNGKYSHLCEICPMESLTLIT